MKVLIIGSGSREHTLVWKMLLSPQVDQVYCAPGNGGTGVLAYNVPVAATNVHALAAWAAENQIDLTIVGPERPLVEGVVDVFQAAGLRIFGPTARAAVIEGSKVWTKDMLARYGIPSARSEVITEYSQVPAALDRCSYPIVVKADGDAAGKGVVIARDRETALKAATSFMVERTVGAAGDRVLLEEFLEGIELSVLAFTDGKTIIPMAPACDYKRVGDGDHGPNTGGMGAYARPQFATPILMDTIQKTILEPTVAAMAAEGRPYSGVLYAGLMITSDGPKVLEYNCRFGDPEAQVVLPLLKTDLVDVVQAVIDERLAGQPIEWDDRACCGVVMASEGYPGDYPTGLPITGLDELEEGVMAFHGGTKIGPARPLWKDPLERLKKELLIDTDGPDMLVTAGGRVLTLVAADASMAGARDKVYRNIGKIQFEGAHYRTDIALRELPADSHQPATTSGLQGPGGARSMANGQPDAEDDHP